MACERSAVKFLLQLMKKRVVAESTGELCVRTYFFIYEAEGGKLPPSPSYGDAYIRLISTGI